MQKSILQKITRFCAYQERTQQEVREKLRSFKIFGEEAEEIISYLVTENFINEERLAISFAGGKFRTKQWGKQKIEYALRQKHLSEHCIRKGLEAIEQTEYEQTLTELLRKKYELLTQEEPNLFLRKQKTFRYALQKGYELDLIQKLGKGIFPRD
ncbi:MAG: RecX family transcriptional regulator [Microscillaceae bacterium]|nr:RecX family transcriptional regulator [Microscillaceae bacterium]MDW8461422.1 regulatory protein RecX [Cytophagales bacterium]